MPKTIIEAGIKLVIPDDIWAEYNKKPWTFDLDPEIEFRCIMRIEARARIQYCHQGPIRKWDHEVFMWDEEYPEADELMSQVKMYGQNDSGTDRGTEEEGEEIFAGG